MNMFVLFNIVSGNVANLALRILDAKPSFNLKAWFSIYNSKTKFASLPRTILINTNIFNFKIEVSRKKMQKKSRTTKKSEETHLAKELVLLNRVHLVQRGLPKCSHYYHGEINNSSCRCELDLESWYLDPSLVPRCHQISLLRAK